MKSTISTEPFFIFISQNQHLRTLLSFNWSIYLILSLFFVNTRYNRIMAVLKYSMELANLVKQLLKNVLKKTGIKHWRTLKCYTHFLVILISLCLSVSFFKIVFSCSSVNILFSLPACANWIN